MVAWKSLIDEADAFGVKSTRLRFVGVSGNDFSLSSSSSSIESSNLEEDALGVSSVRAGVALDCCFTDSLVSSARLGVARVERRGVLGSGVAGGPLFVGEDGCEESCDLVSSCILFFRGERCFVHKERLLSKFRSNIECAGRKSPASGSSLH